MREPYTSHPRLPATSCYSKASSYRSAVIDPKMGWSDFVTSRLLLYRIPGGHALMFDDEGAVALIAEHLRPLLNQADAARRVRRHNRH